MSALECVRRVYQLDGLRGFYRGMSASYAGISETVIHFVIYESIKRRLLEAKMAQNMDAEEEVPKVASDFVGMMLAAATSKTCATTIAYPHGESSGAVRRRFIHQFKLIYANKLTSISFGFEIYRSDSHQVTRGGDKVQVLLPDFKNSAQRGGLCSLVPWAHHSPGAADPQHCHHDVHL